MLIKVFRGELTDYSNLLLKEEIRYLEDKADGAN